MNSRNLMTHGCAVLAGIALAIAVSNKVAPVKDKKVAVDSAVQVPVPRTAREVVVRPRDLLRSLAGLPMERSERYELKRQIYEDWAKRDPLGFLNYFEHRPWLGYMGGASPFEILAKTQPEELLAYARRTGCKDAVASLVGKGDLYRVLDVLGADGLARLPKDVLTEFVRRGEAADPQFHERLAVITEEDTRKAAFQYVAERMADAGRLDDLLGLITQHPEGFEDSLVGSNVAALLARDPREMDRLDSLSESLRSATAKAMISELDNDEVGEDGRREILAGLASRGLVGKSGMELFEMITERGEDLPSQELENWKTWAMSLPQNNLMRPLRVSSMSMWSYRSQAGPDQLATLPSGEMRDAAVVGAVASLMEQEKPLEAYKLAGEIGDTTLRANFLNFLKLSETGDEPDEFDPFGLGGTNDAIDN